MYLFQLTALMVLMISFGILLPAVYIQPAQGLKCHFCEPCKSNTDLGSIRECVAAADYCVFGQVEQTDGRQTAHRSCATLEFTQDYPCNKFTPAKDDPKVKLRPCACKGDLCNNKDATIGALDLSTQLLPFRILMAVSVLGLLMIN